jgi:hypothetical protein
MNSIIAGYNNIVTGSQNSIGTCGSIGFGGTIGANGTGGPGSGAYQITDWKEEMQKKYHNRFIIKTDYDAMTFAPTNIIIDNTTNREYIFIPKNMSNIVKETDKFIQTLIVMIRDEKLDNIING